MLRPFTDIILKSIGGSAAYVYNIYKSVLTGQDCSLFKTIDWKSCSKDPKLKELGKRILKVSEEYRDTHINLITEFKELLSDYLTEKTYFDTEDAKNYASALKERYSSTANISDVLIEMTLLIDTVSGKNEAKFKKQLNNLNSRIQELESKMILILPEINLELSEQVHFGKQSEKDLLEVKASIPKLLTGESLNMTMKKNKCSLSCQYSFRLTNQRDLHRTE